MAFAFNEVASRGQLGRDARAGRQGRGEAASEELPAAICSDDSCIGYTWVSKTRPSGGDPIPSWLGADMIAEHRWRSIMPPYVGRNLILEFLDLSVDVQIGFEPGRRAYPHVRYAEVHQWHRDLNTGTMTSRPVSRYGQRIQGRFYAPIDADPGIIYRARTRSCGGPGGVRSFDLHYSEGPEGSGLSICIIQGIGPRTRAARSPPRWRSTRERGGQVFRFALFRE